MWFRDEGGGRDNNLRFCAILKSISANYYQFWQPFRDTKSLSSANFERAASTRFSIFSIVLFCSAISGIAVFNRPWDSRSRVSLDSRIIPSNSFCWESRSAYCFADESNVESCCDNDVVILFSRASWSLYNGSSILLWGRLWRGIPLAQNIVKGVVGHVFRFRGSTASVDLVGTPWSTITGWSRL